LFLLNQSLAGVTAAWQRGDVCVTFASEAKWLLLDSPQAAESLWSEVLKSQRCALCEDRFLDHRGGFNPLTASRWRRYCLGLERRQNKGAV